MSVGRVAVAIDLRCCEIAYEAIIGDLLLSICCSKNFENPSSLGEVYVIYGGTIELTAANGSDFRANLFLMFCIVSKI